MSDYGNLNDRVEKAVEKFQKSEQQRRNENQSLSRILNDLHTKFDARTMELDHCQQRIVQLEGSNDSLSGLVTRLVEIVEETADDAAEDPVYNASAAASDIVDRYVGGTPANDTPEISGPELEGGRNARPITEAEAFGGPAGRLENIEEEFLLAEDLYEKSEGASSFPKLVYDAVALASGEEATGAQPADEQIDIPEPMVSQAEISAPDGELDIKEIMARLEIAAERAQIRADEDTRLDQIEPEDLDRAVGGHA